MSAVNRLPLGLDYQMTVTTQGRLENVEQFENIVIKTGEDGEVVRLKDVARVDLGAKDYTVISRLDGQPAINIGIFQAPGSNALEVSKRVRAEMEKLKERFPPGVDYRIIYDTTMFVKEAIFSVMETIIEAFLLVVFVVLVFLQSWRSTLIPIMAVPVSLIGTFAVMLAFGFSLNLLTLLGLVLAIGIVVDDAIVVVEAVEHHMAEGLGTSGRHDQGNERGRRADRRDHRCVVVRLHPHSVHPGLDGFLLPAVRLDDRLLDHPLDGEFADLKSCHVRLVSAAAQGAKGPLGAGARRRAWAGSSDSSIAPSRDSRLFTSAS